MKLLNDKLMLAITLIVLSVIVYSIYALSIPKSDRYQPSIISDKPSSKVIFPENQTEVFVEIANSTEEITLGLSYRESLDSDTGMLFDLGYEDTYPSFWMKGMNFPLDMIWINDNQIVDIHQNVPNEPLNTPDEDLPLYRPSKPVDMILEVNAGFVQEHGIQVGDTIEISR